MVLYCTIIRLKWPSASNLLLQNMQKLQFGEPGLPKIGSIFFEACILSA